MKTITTRLTEVLLSEPKTKTYNNKDGTTKESTYYILTLVGTIPVKNADGEIEQRSTRFTRFQNDTDVAESVGDLVNIAYETSTFKTNKGNEGVNYSIKGVEVLEGADVNTSTITTKITKQPEKSTYTVSTTEQSSTRVSLTPNKDISMEVSGLLQAIINKHGLDSETETRLRTALQLKRAVAAELEQTGAV